MIPFPLILPGVVAFGLAIVWFGVWFADHAMPMPQPKFQERMATWEVPVYPTRPLVIQTIAPLACGPVYCDQTARWRDPVTKRFVKAPATRTLEASAQ